MRHGLFRDTVVHVLVTAAAAFDRHGPRARGCLCAACVEPCGSQMQHRDGRRQAEACQLIRKRRRPRPSCAPMRHRGRSTQASPGTKPRKLAWLEDMSSDGGEGAKESLRLGAALAQGAAALKSSPMPCSPPNPKRAAPPGQVVVARARARRASGIGGGAAPDERPASSPPSPPRTLGPRSLRKLCLMDAPRPPRARDRRRRAAAGAAARGTALPAAQAAGLERAARRGYSSRGAFGRDSE